jgi:hypothetical protein
MVAWTTFLNIAILSCVSFLLSACGVLTASKSDLSKILPSTSIPSSYAAFGKSGVMLWNYQRVGESDDNPLDVLHLEDGRIWIIGRTSAGFNNSGFVKSYNSDGSLDTDFGYQSGSATAIKNQNVLGVHYPMALTQFGDSVYIAGQYDPGDEKVFITKLKKDGTYDSSFNKTGLFTFESGNGYDRVASVAVQADGKILVGGNSAIGYFVIRVNSNGTLDTTFGTAGLFTESFDVGVSNDELFTMLVQPDGKIILAGTTQNGTTKAGVMRVNTNGTLDTTFGTAGKVKTLISSPTYIYGGKILADGSIVFAGNNNSDAIIVKYTSAGVLDTSFNTTGYVIRDFTGDDEALTTMDVQADGKIVVAGAVGPFSSRQAIVARLNSDGSTDTSFNGTGHKVYDLASAPNSMIMKLTVLSDRKFLIMGSYYDSGTSKGYTVVQKLMSTGALDTSFHTTGEKVVNIGEMSDERMEVSKLFANGKFAVAGSSESTSTQAVIISEFNSDGSIDTGFGTGGTVEYSANGGSWERASDLGQQSDGKVLLLMSYSDGVNSKARIVRFTVAGVVDTTFNSTGYNVLNFSKADVTAGYLTVASNDKIYYVGGTSSNVADSSMTVARLNADGTYDTSFNTTGKVELDISSDDDFGTAVYELSDGKVLVVGIDSTNLHVIRLNADGSTDTSFATAGVYSGNPMGGVDSYWLFANVVNDKITLAGNYSGQGFIFQLNDNGSVNTGFGTNGLMTFSSYTSAYMGGASVEDNGKITVVLANTDADGLGEILLKRVNADGTMDASFAPPSFYVPLGNLADVRSFARMSDGGYLVGGVSTFSATEDHFFVRFTENGVE